MCCWASSIALARVSSTLDDVIAVGDGANDLPMLQAVGMGIAYHAKAFVQEQVHARINHCDLTSLLYIQGYNAADIAV